MDVMSSPSGAGLSGVIGVGLKEKVESYNIRILLLIIICVSLSEASTISTTPHADARVMWLCTAVNKSNRLQ